MCVISSYARLYCFRFKFLCGKSHNVSSYFWAARSEIIRRKRLVMTLCVCSLTKYHQITVCIQKYWFTLNRFTAHLKLYCLIFCFLKFTQLLPLEELPGKMFFLPVVYPKVPFRVQLLSFLSLNVFWKTLQNCMCSCNIPTTLRSKEPNPPFVFFQRPLPPRCTGSDPQETLCKVTAGQECYRAGAEMKCLPVGVLEEIITVLSVWGCSHHLAASNWQMWITIFWLITNYATAR